MATTETQNAAGRTAADRSDDLIRRLVLEGFYAPGERISDLKLSERIGVGRMHVRESFQRLAKEGILTVVPNRGAFVTELEPDEIAELLELREAIEVEAARLAAQRAPLEGFAPLREMLEISRLSLVQHGGLYPMDLDFHEALVRLTGNRRLEAVSREVNTLLRLARARATHSHTRWRESIQEHADVLGAIEARDAGRAESLMRHHLAMSRKALHPQVAVTAPVPAVEAAGG